MEVENVHSYTANNIIVHNCAHLLLNGDIREEIGLIRCESKSTKKSALCACIDGTTADHYRYLKTDLLIVDVVGLTEAIWERIGKPSISNSELERLLACDEGKKAWDIYAKGYTLCVNQCEKDGTRKKCMRYKMKNTGELSAFVAGVRPGFKSLFNNFLDRKPYSTGVPQLDEILKDSYHYLLYQESIMAYLNWLGIDMKETYEIVKKISKKVFLKHPEQLEELKSRLLPQWVKNVGTIEGFEETFKVVQDAGSYAFNSAHSYCVGNDGAEIAYLKAYYPYETYEVCLNWFDRKKNKDKVALLKQEMFEAFGIKEGELKWGNDNRHYSLDKENKCIHPCLSSIKGIGKNVASELYDLYQNKQYNSFIELLLDLETTSITSTMIEELIKLQYFDCFGKSKKLLKTYNLYNNIYKKKQFKKETMSEDSIEIFRRFANKETDKLFKEVNSIDLINYVLKKIPNEDIPLRTLLEKQIELLGNISYIDNSYEKDIAVVTEIKINGYGTPFLTLYQLSTGKSITIKANKKYYQNKPLSKFDTIKIIDVSSKHKKRKDKETGKWIQLEETENILESYALVID